MFQTPIDLAHSYWEKILTSGDLAIDATCGNGHDTLMLSKLALSTHSQGKVFAIDTQIEAIQNTEERLKTSIDPKLLDKVFFYHQCHSSFPQNILKGSVKLIVYNLGYLPRGNKEITTKTNTTLESLNNALHLIAPSGALSITCYPGHAEGKIEEDAVINFCKNLPPDVWSACHHRWVNRKDAPSLVIIQKADTT